MGKKANKYTVIDLFCGCGGLSTGLRAAGLPIQIAIDFDEAACATYQKNHRTTQVWCRDIQTVTGEEIRKVVGHEKRLILSGGPPCQSWSEFKIELDGMRGLKDKRGQLIYEYLRLAIELKPDFVVFENVSYLVKEEHMPAFLEFKDKFQKLTGLILEFKVLNAIDYGCGQLRERVIMFGYTPGCRNPFDFLQPMEGPKTLREVLHNVPPSEYFELTGKDAEIMKMIGEGKCWNSLPPQIAMEAMRENYRGICKSCNTPYNPFKTPRCPTCRSTEYRNGYGITSYYRRLSFDKPSYTICAVPTNKVHGMLAHPCELRGLSIRESARIQGFADSYDFVGTIHQKQKQIGNAVPVPLAKQIGMAIKEAIRQSSVKTSLNATPAPTPTNDAEMNEWMNWIYRIQQHPKRSFLTSLERDFLNSVYVMIKQLKPIPRKYSFYLQETFDRLSLFKN